MENINSKLIGMTSGELWEVVYSLKDSLDDASEIVFTSALNALSEKVSDDKFLELLGKL